MLIDTHAHIYLDQFKEDRVDMIERAREKAVEKILMPNIDHTSIDDMMELEDRFPKVCHAMMGLHPCSVDHHFEKVLYEVEEWLGKRDFIAVGEIGTDLYWDKSFWTQQKEAFGIQCQLALQHHLPIVVHCRDSIAETIELVAPFAGQLKGVFHCFTGTVAQGKVLQDMGFYLGIGGIATFKNGGLDQVIPELDLDLLLLETDSPYLAPKPYRGKRNEPSYVPLIADKVADFYDMSVDKVGAKTTENGRKLLGLS
jgi:TatD DNase family protein